METKCPTCHRPYIKKRSNNQNRYYWGIVVDIISNYTGFTPEETHDILKHKFLAKQKTFKDMVFYVPASTATLTTAESEKYFSSIREWASIELGCWVPEPNEENA